jgi:pimeloyl-ACP methyl ester carboxylesterase
MNTTLGHEKLGAGPRTVVVLNDWMCDTSTWDGARSYLDLQRFTWLFADLRGYGRSRTLTGQYNLGEAAADVLGLADALGLAAFSIVGHSMSTLVALHLAQSHAARVSRAVLLTPAPPRAFGADAETLGKMQAVARGADEGRLRLLRMRWGERLSEGFIQYKLKRWRASSDAEAVATYIAMFARDGLPDPASPIRVPVLAVTGEQDAEIMRCASVSALLAPLCEQLVVTPLADSGHYPMQETPPLLVSIVERFLAAG